MHDGTTRGHKTLGFKWYAKRLTCWQSSYRLIGSRLPTGALLQENCDKAFKLGTANVSRP